MKKSIISIIVLEILLITLVFSSTVTGKIKENTSVQKLVQKELKENENVSMNYLLKYPTIEGYQESMEAYGEVAIQNNTKQAMFSIDIFDDKNIDIFKGQEEIFATFGTYEVVSEDTSQLDDRTIKKKIYNIKSDFSEFYAMIGTIEIKGVNDKIIGVVGNVPSLEFESDFDTLLSSTNYTKISIDEKRLFDSELENFTMSVLPDWKRLEKVLPFSFYKDVEDSITYFIASSGNISDADPSELLKGYQEDLLMEETAYIVEDSTVRTVKDKTITTSIISYKDAPVTNLISFIMFENSNTFILVRADVLVKINPLEIETEEHLTEILNSPQTKDITNSVISEVNTMIESIKLKDIKQQDTTNSEESSSSEENISEQNQE